MLSNIADCLPPLHLVAICSNGQARFTGNRMETWDVWNEQISEKENKKAVRVWPRWSKVNAILQILTTEAFESLYKQQ